MLLTIYFALAFAPALHCAIRPDARQKYSGAMRPLQYMLPISDIERRWWVFLSISAGVCEEVFTAEAKIERYMAWPGQALGYKAGALKIAELRQRARSARGVKFSLPAFHAVVLGGATLLLAVLEQQVDLWIAESK